MVKQKTQKELQADIDKTLAEAEALKDKPVEEEDESEEETEDEPEVVEEEVDESEEDPETEEEAPIEEAEPEKPSKKGEEEVEEPEEEPELKKKLSASARENQKILQKNRKINEAIDEADELPEPTDEEMKTEFPDWDIMEDYAKELAKEAVVNKKFRLKLAEARRAGQKIEKWNEEVDEFVQDPETLVKNPELDGRLEDFKLYASEEVNAKIPFKVLVPAFLHNSNIKPKNKGGMFPKGSAGPSTPDKTDNKLTLMESRKLRETDYAKYKRYLKAGRIKDDL